jgi:hypothetical protein
MPRDNGYVDILRASRQLSASTHRAALNATGASQVEAAQAAAFAAEVAAANDLVRTGLAKEIKCPRPWGAGDPPSPTLFRPHLRELGRALDWLAAREEATGHLGKAADVLLDAVEAGAVLPRGGGWEDLRISATLEAASLPCIERMLGRLSASDMARVAARLDRIAARRPSLADALLEDRDRNSVRIVAWQRDPQGSVLVRTWERVRGQDRVSALSRERDRAAAFAADCRYPLTGKPHVKLPPGPSGLPSDDILRMIRGDHATTLARAAILRTEVALYRYRAAHGRFPDTLEGLVPGNVKALPEDPFAGAFGVPMRYRAEADGRAFTLYSRGRNLRDDGGRRDDVVAGRLVPKRRPWWQRTQPHGVARRR